ncbi:MAG: hypothetical protein ACE5F1_07965 [Planctomycetota bacterium]
MIPLLLQSGAGLARVRRELPLPLGRLCQKLAGYAARSDAGRAAKVLAMLRPYVVAYDRKWNTMLAPKLESPVLNPRLPGLRSFSFVLVYADLRDVLAELELLKKPDVRRARHLLRTAKLDYTLISQAVLARENGKALHARFTRDLRSMLGWVPTLRGYGNRKRWVKGLAAQARGLRLRLGAALPKLEAAIAATTPAKKNEGAVVTPREKDK